jgi:hypothetical protein
MSTVIVKIEDLHKAAMAHPGMLQAFIEAGELQGSVVAIERSRFDELNAHYFKGLKLGSALHAVLKPVVRAVDAVVGSSLQNCQACVGRELRMNAAV